MPEPGSSDDGARPDVLTGHDLAVLVCRGLAIWVFVLGYSSVTSPMLQGYLIFASIDADSGLRSTVQGFLTAILMVVLFVTVYVAIGLTLWRRADRIADRMLGAAGDRAMPTGFTLEIGVRAMLMSMGLWLGIPALLRLAESVIGYLLDLYPAADRMLLSALLNPGVYLIVSLFLIFGSGTIARALLRVKSVGLNPPDRDATSRG